MSFQGAGLRGESERGSSEVEEFWGESVHETLVRWVGRKDLSPSNPAKFSSQVQTDGKAAKPSLQCDELCTSPPWNPGSLCQNQGSQLRFTPGLSPYLPPQPSNCHSVNQEDMGESQELVKFYPDVCI